MDRLAIEFICAMGMPPVDFIRMVSGLGVSRIGLAANPITDNPHGFLEWNLRTNRALLDETKSALADYGVELAQGEGFLIMPGTDIIQSEDLADIMAELGAPSLNCVIIEQDRPRAIEQFARFAGMANQRGMAATIEFMPLMWPANFQEAMDVIAQAGAANGKLLIDAMHFYRSGAQTSNLKSIDPSLIGYVQLCDVPMAQDGAMTPEMMQAYGEEARHERRCPDDGDLPLADFLTALPSDVTIGLEIPILSAAKAGVSPVDAIRPCVEASRRLLGETA